MKFEDLKFRYWHPELKKMFYFPLFSDNSKLMKREGCIIMQYTGLKDKNGKEIYEGDIVKVLVNVWKGNKIIKIKQYIGDVLYCNDISAFIINKTEKEWRPGYLFGMLEGCEVIGNIYENPNLGVEE